jgi:hypothetical protein
VAPAEALDGFGEVVPQGGEAGPLAIVVTRSLFLVEAAYRRLPVGDVLDGRLALATVAAGRGQAGGVVAGPGIGHPPQCAGSQVGWHCSGPVPGTLEARKAKRRSSQNPTGRSRSGSWLVPYTCAVSLWR